MNWLDRWSEHSARRIAQLTSRRSALARLGRVLVGGALLPLLPIDRVTGTAWAAAGEAARAQADPGDPRSCSYWRYCGIDGWLCACCGGTAHSCPPGAEPSPLTWVGTCSNPADGIDYIISYNDCCAKGSCGQCFCNRNEEDKPLYRPQSNNDIDWCLGTSSMAYHCSTAVILGAAKR
ncbi:MAG: amine dehydrogenase [Betaproteobacteria bacterium]|nr:amine dehydrogenase [Betaproteobacteria bacterium]MDE2209268.1 amine dehydrogenase [Betaproteobacteria bacterium]